MKTMPFFAYPKAVPLILGAMLCASAQGLCAQTETSAPPFSAQVGTTATQVTQETMDNAQLVWKRIDEKRLKNRTPDELVAWALMGILVGGVLHRFSKLSQGAAIVVGLVGAFIGGIVANVLQLNWGLGPVLIRYEELLCSLIGGVVLFLALRWFTARKGAAAAPKAAPKTAPK
jgi:uncharacterized membrane protein YeaQ/YmgE (transglycosylase-associated protein family)